MREKLSRLLQVPFVRNVAKFQVGNLVLQGTGLLGSILYARLLGLEQFGVYALVSAFAGLVTIVAALGQETTLATFLAEEVGRKNTKEIRTVLRYFLQSSFSASGLLLLLMPVLPFIALLLRNDPNIAHFARLILLNTALQFPAVLAFLILQLQNRIGLLSILENARAILQLCCSVFFLWFGFGVGGLLTGILLISALYVPLCTWIYVHYAPALQFPPLGDLLRNLYSGGTKKYFLQGFWIALDRNVSRNLYPNAFSMILNAFASVEAVGVFQLAFRLAEAPSKILMPSIARMSAVTIPRIVGGDRKSLKKTCIQLIKGTVALRMLSVIGAALIVPFLVPVLYGPEFRAAIPVFLILLPYHLFSALNVASVPLARVFGKTWLMTTVNTTGIGIAIALSFLLMPLFSPIVAIAISILYYHMHALLLPLFLWVHVRKERGFSPVTLSR